MTLDRRRLVISAAGLAVGGMASVRLLPEEMLLRDRRAPRSRVAVLSAEQYSERLVELLLAGPRRIPPRPGREVSAPQAQPRRIHSRRRSEYESSSCGCSGRGISQA